MKKLMIFIISLTMLSIVNVANAKVCDSTRTDISSRDTWCGYASTLEDPSKLSFDQKGTRLNNAADRCNKAKDTDGDPQCYTYVLRTGTQSNTVYVTSDRIAKGLTNAADRCDGAKKIAGVKKNAAEACNSAYKALRKKMTKDAAGIDTRYVACGVMFYDPNTACK